MNVFKRTYYNIISAVRVVTGKVAPTLYCGEIESHFEQLFNTSKDKHRVFHELVSEKVHIDLHLLEPTEEFPYFVLFTTGMSDLPMNLEGSEWAFKKIYERSELFCILNPEEFPVWMIELMKKCAIYPHICNSFIIQYNTLQLTEDNHPFADDTELSSVFFTTLKDTAICEKYGDKLEYIQTTDSNYINLLYLYPIYAEELEYKLENDSHMLFEKLFPNGIASIKDLVIDP